MVVDRRHMEGSRHLDISYGLIVTVLGVLLTFRKLLGNRRWGKNNSLVLQCLPCARHCCIYQLI